MSARAATHARVRVRGRARALLPLLVFSKCAEAMEEGRRYENLSWRLWNREALCCNVNNAQRPALDPSSSSSSSPRPRRRTSSSSLTRASPNASTSVLNSASASASAPSPRSSPSSGLSSSNPSRPTQAETDDLPELSVSVESAISDRDDEDGNDDNNKNNSNIATAHAVELRSIPLDIGAPAIRRLDSFGARSRSRCRERHLTPLHLERMFSSIKAHKELEPLELSPGSRNLVVRSCATDSRQPSMAVVALRRPASPSPADVAASADKSANASNPTTFQPVRSAADVSQRQKMFLLGGSSGEDESSLDDHMRPTKPQRSVLAEGLRAAPADRKQTSFSEEVVTRTIREDSEVVAVAVAEDDAAAVIDEDDDEDEDIDDDDDDDDDDGLSESVIEEDDDEDDDSEWDSVTESGPASIDEKPLFQRVDSKPNLTSRRSLLTNLLHQSHRADAFAQAAAAAAPQAKSAPTRRSRASAQPTGVTAAATVEADEDEDEDDDDEAAVEEEEEEEEEEEDDDEGTNFAPRATRSRADVPRSRPIIMTASTTHPPALSPRTTRRNMLATELTESLRRHLLWERQQKNTTATAVLKRRHTAHDMARLQEYPHDTSSREASKNNSWNHYYFDLGLGEYHQKGW